ncbi:hypothetical protein A9Q99_04605 [Gammaproteobacteria bacterium 45_16_T64]|nr:hypothetical protein A9Q99_04605 [Gammaproteobacteria bacterium 45_16_T64]
MSVMIKFWHLKQAFAVGLVLLLSACGASVKVDINSHSPSNSSVIYASDGESLAFSAFGPVYSPYNETLLQVGVRAQWEVYEYEPDNYLTNPVFNIMAGTRTGQSIAYAPATFLNATRFEFTIPENQPSQYYLVTYTVYRHIIGGSWKFADSSRSWLIYAGDENQVPPEWEGDFLVGSIEDINKLEGYTSINGTLSIMPFTSEESDNSLLDGDNQVIAISKIDHRDLKYTLPLGIRTEENLITDISALENINHVGGNLNVFHNERLTSFDKLNNLLSVDGNLMVYKNNQITDLEGFNNLTVLGGDLYFQSNQNLESIDALKGLQRLEGAAVFAWNEKLTDLAGLENVSSVGGRLSVTGSSSLESLGALSNIEFVGGNLEIRNNDLLTSLSGLESLLTVGEDLVIDGNEALLSLDSLENLSSVFGATIRSNPMLTNLEGLNNLTEIPGNIMVEYHKSLQSLSALGMVDFVGGNLDVTHNYVLENLSGLAGVTRIEGILNIQQNSVLTSIEDLNNLGYIQDGFHIKGNFNLCESKAVALYDLVESRDGVNSDIVSFGNDKDC